MNAEALKTLAIEMAAKAHKADVSAVKVTIERPCRGTFDIALAITLGIDSNTCKGVATTEELAWAGVLENVLFCFEVRGDCLDAPAPDDLQRINEALLSVYRPIATGKHDPGVMWRALDTYGSPRWVLVKREERGFYGTLMPAAPLVGWHCETAMAAVTAVCAEAGTAISETVPPGESSWRELATERDRHAARLEEKIAGLKRELARMNAPAPTEADTPEGVAAVIWADAFNAPPSSAHAYVTECGPNEFVAFVEVGSGGDAMSGAGETEAQAWASLLESMLDLDVPQDFAARARVVIAGLHSTQAGGAQ